MIKIKKTVSEGYFLFQGRASANSSFIEDLIEAKQFIIFANYYLKGYLKIHEYLLTRDGWVFIVKINKLDTIRKTIFMDMSEDIDNEMVWRIISERMRILLSTFVKYTNKRQGRTGGKVHSSYERFVFETLKEAKEYIAMMRDGLIRLCQRRKKYRAKKSHYRIPRKLGRGSIFMSSRKLRKRIIRCKERLEVLELLKSGKHVLRNAIKSTLQHAFLQNNPKKHREPQ